MSESFPDERRYELYSQATKNDLYLVFERMRPSPISSANGVAKIKRTRRNNGPQFHR